MIMKTQIKISFKSIKQTPYLMIIKEYFEDSKIVHAEVIYQEDEYESDIIFEEEFIISKEYRIERKGELL